MKLYNRLREGRAVFLMQPQLPHTCSARENAPNVLNYGTQSVLKIWPHCASLALPCFGAISYKLAAYFKI